MTDLTVVNTGALAMSNSYFEFAERLKTRGFWEVNVICNNPKKCKEKMKEVLKLANHYQNIAFNS
jgi:hypothetical protein